MNKKKLAGSVPGAIRRNPRRTAVISIAILLLAAVAVALWYFLKPKPAPPAPPVVGTEVVKTGNVNIYGEYVGRIRAQQFVEVRAPVEGYLQEILFEEGTPVKKGQLLFVIDPTLYKARTERARAQLNKARVNAKKAERDLERIKPLYEQNAASQLDYDNARTAYETATAEVLVAQTDLTQAELTLGYTTVEAIADGIITEPQADLGTLVGPGGKSLLATIVRSDTVMVYFSMTANDYLRSKERNVNFGSRDSSRGWEPTVTVTLADGKTYPLPGVVDFASPQVDPATGTFSVRAAMPNPDHQLLPGEFTRVKLLMDVRGNALTVPSKAIVVEKGGAYIFVVRPDSVVEKRFVETGPEVGDNKILIERGIARGEHIVTEGYHKLRHGMKVAPTEQKSDPEASSEK
ncbi:MAG: efflux RND transporter periplasmic adaptor subunit [Muribaculaceae bacterium]|nr:efflux RND transporter periplasmic adaptor subunit [Muribaculaceae bacterium]